LKGLAAELGLKNSEVESLVTVLKSTKVGHLIKQSGGTISLVESPDLPPSISIPRSGERTQALAPPKSDIPSFMPEASQIDAVVLRILKANQTVRVKRLLADISGMLPFAVSVDRLTARLKRLEDRRFLVQDASGGLRYVP
jgi:hypothetical protein